MSLLQAVQDGSLSEELITEVQSAVGEANVEYLSTEITSAIQESLEGILRVAEIVRAMRGFSHPGMEGKTVADINDIIRGAITVTRNEWKHVAEMETDFGVSLPLVPCLPGAFSQVIVNVLINAAHALANTGNTSSRGSGRTAGTANQSFTFCIHTEIASVDIFSDIGHVR